MVFINIFEVKKGIVMRTFWIGFSRCASLKEELATLMYVKFLCEEIQQWILLFDEVKQWDVVLCYLSLGHHVKRVEIEFVKITALSMEKS